MSLRALQVLTALAILSFVAPAGRAAAGDVPRNWPMPPAELERRFHHDGFRVRSVETGLGGKTGASRLTIAFDDGVVLRVKWKAAPHGTADGWNNSPRKELAAYAIQRWVVDENDYLIPTVAPRCIALDEYGAIEAGARPTLDDATCVLGAVAVWLEEVAPPPTRSHHFFRRGLFETDALYARYMADFNVVMYLVDHRDGRTGNLLNSTVAGDPRVFAVDNGISFDTLPWNMLVINWHKIRVPWLRRATIDRLRRVGKADVAALGVLAELARDDSGVYRVTTAGPNLDPGKGARVRKGRVQLGLDDDEIDDLHERIDELLERVDEGRIEVR